MKIGDEVKTQDGKGVIFEVEFYSRINGGVNRFGIKLDFNRYFYPIVYYFEDELIT